MIKSIVLQRHEGGIAVRYDEAGEGRLYLLLHGGAGPKSMSGLADALAGDGKVVLPTHPGFDGQVRPDWLSSIRQLAEIYVDFVERQGARNVTVIGSSVGGWIAAEMSLLVPSRISRLVLLNAVGIDPDPHGEPIVDPMTLPAETRAKLAFHDPSRFAIAPSTPEAVEAILANQRTLRIYAGEPFMHDPSLRVRLADLLVPALVLWGEDDGIVETGYGRRYSQAIRNGIFRTIPRAGHFPHIEQLDLVHGHIREFPPTN